MPLATAKPLAKIERQTTATRVERVLRDAILRGDYVPGEKLPAERDLATTLGVTRVTLRSALARLGASGLVSTVQGDGHRVRDVRLHGGLERLPEMADAFAGDATRVSRLVGDLLALRRTVMADAAATCASLPASGRVELGAHVALMESALADEELFAALDLEFGRMLLRLSGNLAYQLTYNTMISFAEGHRELMRVLYSDRELLLEGVKSLLLVLAFGDPDLARAAVRTALEALDANRVATIRATLSRGAPPKSVKAPKPTPR
jgi:GntR family transcriptional repressor for pyruvate dehydrogenase complex